VSAGSIATARLPRSAQPLTGAAIEVEGLVRRFGERDALAEVSLSLGKGQTLVVFGPNGAGKTTLLRVLATLLLPHEGSVQVLGHVLPSEAPALRPRVGFLGHEPLLYRELSGRENLTFYARLYRIHDAAARIADLLERTQMARRADEPVRLLSRGMVQRLAICRTVLHDPELLLLDEPLNALDPEAAELTEPLVGRSSGRTRVVTSHDVERGLAEADRVLALRDGRTALLGDAGEIDGDDVQVVYRGRST
jgi:heme exporter protein A